MSHERTLVLNSSYQVVGVIPWKDAISLLYQNKAETLREWDSAKSDYRPIVHDREVANYNRKYVYRIPAIVRLIDNDIFPKHKRIKFSKMNIFYRDDHTCFVPNTLILMRDGGLKEIQKIEVGEEVVDGDGKIQTVEFVNVTKVNEDILKISHRGNGDSIFCTKNHPFLSDNFEWKLAQELTCENKVFQLDLINSDKVSCKISNIEAVKYDGLVYNLQVSGSHTYIANFVVVHNCQYCGYKHEPHSVANKHKRLTIDHIIPQSKGGETSFVNCVTACQECNSKKADKTASEAGMRLLRKPFVPSVMTLMSKKLGRKQIHSSWERYLISSPNASVAL